MGGAPEVTKQFKKHRKDIHEKFWLLQGKTVAVTFSFSENQIHTEGRRDFLRQSKQNIISIPAEAYF